MFTRSLTPLPVSVPTSRVIAAAASGYVTCGISADRKTLYARGINAGTAPYFHVLYQSTDHGASWSRATASDTSISTTGGSIQSVVETDDGELLVSHQAGGATPGNIVKSTGWATSHTTATFAVKLTSTGGYFNNSWGLHYSSFGDDKVASGTSKYVVVCEYGGQTSVTFASGNSDTTDLTKARRVYWSEDHGSTWTKIFDIASYFPNAVGLHCHSAAYDPYWDRIWLTWGDTQTNTVGSGFMELLYSDDHGSTWQTYATNTGDGAQSTTISILPDCVVLGGDNRPGILRFPRAGYRVIGDPQYPVITVGGTGAQMIANNGHRNRRIPGAPYFMSFQGAGTSLYPVLYMSYDGLTWTELYRDQAAAGKALYGVYGPTTDGTIVFVTNSGATNANNLVRVQIENPGSQYVVRRFDLTGDGTTTVFTVAHKMTATPVKLIGFDQRGNAGTYTLTADATNIIVTFAVAPSNAAAISIDLRYA